MDVWELFIFTTVENCGAPMCSGHWVSVGFVKATEHEAVERKLNWLVKTHGCKAKATRCEA